MSTLIARLDCDNVTYTFRHHPEGVRWIVETHVGGYDPDTLYHEERVTLDEAAARFGIICDVAAGDPLWFREGGVWSKQQPPTVIAH